MLSSSNALPLLSQLPAMPRQPGEPQPLPHPEIPEPGQLPAGVPLWLLIGSGIVILLFVALILWLMFRPKAPPKLAPRDALKSAIRGLKSLRSRAGELPPPEIGHQVSEILRRYFQDRYAVPAPCRTSPELFSGPIPEKLRDKFGPLAARYDEMAFAPLPATTAEASSLIESALTRLEDERA